MLFRKLRQEILPNLVFCAHIVRYEADFQFFFIFNFFPFSGAFIFEELEKENELMVKKNMTSNRHHVTEQLWDITR